MTMTHRMMYVQLVNGNSFTEEHADTNREAVSPIAYPHLYGDELPPELKCVHRSILMRSSSIESTALGGTDVNTARAIDGNPKLPAIRSSIFNFGFKLRHPPIAVYRKPDGKVYKINGKTRFTVVVDEWGYEEIIVDVYEANDGYKDDDIEYALHIFGESSNINDDPKGETSVEDLFHGCNHSIKRGWIKKDENGVPEWNSIDTHLTKVCHKSKLTPEPKNQLIARVQGQYNENVTGKRFWDSTEKVISFIEGGGNWNYKKVTTKKDENTGAIIRKGIKYMVFETSEYRRAFAAATTWAHLNPNYEVRVIYYKKYIKATEAAENFVETLERNVLHWNEQINAIKDVHFSSQCNRQTGRCYIYGAVPSLKSLHNLDKMIYLDDESKWLQKV